MTAMVCDKNIEKLNQMNNWLTENPAMNKDQGDMIVSILLGLRAKIQFEYDTIIDEKMANRKNLNNFYAKAMDRIKNIPEDILNIPASKMVNDQVDFMDEIMFAQPSNAEKLILDKYQVAKCAKKIMGHERSKKFEKLYNSKKKFGFSKTKKRVQRKKQNRNNNIYSKSALRKKLNNSGAKYSNLRNPIIDKSLFRSKTPKQKIRRGRRQKKRVQTSNKKRFNSKNQLGRGLINKKFKH